MRALRSSAVPVCALSLVILALSGLSSCARPGEDRGQQTGAVVVDSCQGVADDALCNDQNACTQGDHCVTGACVGTVAPDGTPCTDGNQCTATDLCSAGICKGIPAPDGTPCTKGDPCTEPDHCTAGACVDGPLISCDDGVSCTVDSCVSGTGCKHVPTLICPEAGTDDGGTVDLNPDVSPTDVTPPDGAPPDLGAGGGPAGGAPGQGGAGGAAGAGGTAAGGGGGEGGAAGRGEGGAGGDSGEGGGAGELPKVYAAQGGACVCSASGTPGSLTGLAMVGAILVSARRRRVRR